MSNGKMTPMHTIRLLQQQLRASFKSFVLGVTYTHTPHLREMDTIMMVIYCMSGNNKNNNNNACVSEEDMSNKSASNKVVYHLGTLLLCIYPKPQPHQLDKETWEGASFAFFCMCVQAKRKKGSLHVESKLRLHVLPLARPANPKKLSSL